MPPTLHFRRPIAPADTTAKPVLAKSRPKVSVLDFPRDALLERITAILAAKGVSRAYLVGSLARDEAHHWSDIDLIVVLDTDIPFVERPRLFDELWEIGVPVDILVYTPKEFAGMEADPTPFWRDCRRSRLQLLPRPVTAGHDGGEP